MNSVADIFSNLFSTLSSTFPDCCWDLREITCSVFTPQARDSDEETLISESNSEGKKFSNMFREKHGEDCNQFMDSSLMDAVTTHVFYDKIGNNCSNWAETDSRLYVISSSWKWRSFSKVVICTRYWWIGCFHLLLLWNTWKRIVFVGVVMSLQSMVIR